MRQRILQSLYNTPGTYISGHELALDLGISRTAVWKHIEALKAEGYDISGTSGRGYTLNQAENIIIPEQLQTALANISIVRDNQHFTSVDSTNNVARRLLEESKIEAGTLITSNYQTAGKGRRGRKWVDPPGVLTFSLVLKPDLPIQEIPLLSLVLAVAVSRALDTFLRQGSQIKWPNDVLAEGNKLVGILLELSGEIDRPDYVIAGIGVNVNTSRKEFPPEIQARATSLYEEEQHRFSQTVVLFEILQQIDHYYALFLSQGFGSIRAEFKQRCLHLGQKVSLDLGARVLTGVNTDIDEAGNLLIDTGEKLEKLSTGDVAVL